MARRAFYFASMVTLILATALLIALRSLLLPAAQPRAARTVLTTGVLA